MTSTTRHPISIIQGGQYGSESKGAVASHLALRDKIDFAVRTGATNAGHVVYAPRVNHDPEAAATSQVLGRFTMQQLPCGWVRPETSLVIGAGALVDLDILDRELNMIEEATGRNPRARTFIDARAFVHRREHAERSAASGRHHAIGATGKGCSEALVERIQARGSRFDHGSLLIGENRTDGRLRGVVICDTESLLNQAWDQGARIQLEGTQGQLLDLYLGPYPYTTHKQTGPAQWLLEAGLSPSLPTAITMVVRTHPIRVAGNSGPLRGELSWIDLARHINDRRMQAGITFLVDEDSIAAFEEALLVAGEDFELPPGDRMALRQHQWPDHHRLQFREALSELNKRALELVGEQNLLELKKLFEMTTVTKKLRRIASIDLHALRIAARQVRPAEVAVTFLNYVCPEYWGSSQPLTHPETAFLGNITFCCQAPVTLVNRGPLPQHMIECRVVEAEE